MTRSIPTVLAALAAFACLLSPPPAPADVFDLGAGYTSLELVSVGNAGEGNVDYSYMIGKYEVTARQYTEFLNAVAETDSNGLYDSRMSSHDQGCKIERLEDVPGSYSYKVGSDDANRPVNFVTWSDAARFVNWLHHGQLTEAEMPGITEDGAYTMNGEKGLALGVDRNPGARYWLPSDAEWKKAAYYDPTRNNGEEDFGRYPFAHPDGGTISLSMANYYDDKNLAQVKDKTVEVGYYDEHSSYYGTFDQGGNVSEWTERSSTTSRGLRGGFFGSSNSFLRSSNSGMTWSPDGYCMGFRIAGVPEPGGMAALIGMAAVGFVWFWRRR